MPKVYDQEIKLSAMKLWLEGLSGPKIVAKLNEEFAIEVKLPTLYVWAKQLKWNEQLWNIFKNLKVRDSLEFKRNILLSMKE